MSHDPSLDELVGDSEVGPSVPMKVAAGLLVIAAVLAIGVGARTVKVSAERRDALRDVEVARRLVEDARERVGRQADLSPEDVEAARADLLTEMRHYPSSSQLAEGLSSLEALASSYGLTALPIDRQPGQMQDGPDASVAADQVSLAARGSVPDLLEYLLGVLATFPLTPQDIRLEPGAPAVARVELIAHYVPDTSAPGSSGQPSAESTRGDPQVLALEMVVSEATAARNWAMALAAGERLLILVPDREDVWRTLYSIHVEWGRDLAADGRVVEAGAEFRRALEVTPGGVEALAELERIASTPPGVLSPTGGPGQSDAGVHVVGKGDTLIALAERYNTTVGEIMRVNGLTETTIYVGQKLTIPSGSQGK